MNDQATQDWEAYADEQDGKTPTMGDNAKAVLSSQISQLAMEDAEIERLEAELKAAKERRTKLVETVIPATFEDMGLDDESVMKVDGKGVTIQTVTYASPKAADREKVYDWLEEHGHGGLIKRTGVFKTGRDNEKKFKAWIKSIKTYPGDFQRKVEPATLKAFVNEQLKAGTEIPMTLFGAYTKRVAKVTE